MTHITLFMTLYSFERRIYDDYVDTSTPASRLPDGAVLAVAEASFELFLQRGFATTTAAQAAKVAGVSVRTFHRYFRSKDQAVETVLDAGARVFVEHFAARDHREGLVTSLAESLRLTIEQDRWTQRFLTSLHYEPVFLRSWLRVHETCQDNLRPVLAERLGLDSASHEARFAATVVVSANRIAVEAWAANPRTSYATVLQSCLAPLVENPDRRWLLEGGAESAVRQVPASAAAPRSDE